MVAVGTGVTVLAHRGLARLDLVDQQLRDTGRFAEARARLQRRAFELLPATLPGDNVLVGDVLLQLRQARGLGEQLPDDIRERLDALESALVRPSVSRDDLVLAATLLETIVDAESVVQERIFSDAQADVRYERNVTLVGLALLTLLGLVGVSMVPRGRSLRILTRFWLRGVLEQRKTLLRAERLALAGEAAAGMAHELRNPLAGVTLGLQNLERDAEDLAPRIRPLVSELERVTRTLNEHLGALRTPAEAVSDVDVEQLVSDLVDLLRYEATEGVTVAASITPDLACRTQGDRLRQVLLNLGLNALQAMEKGGGRLQLQAERAGDWLEVAVSDTGPGFPEAVLRGAAIPLSGAKPGGMGLGLRLVRRMVGEMGGAVELTNPEGGGASAVVRIPCGQEGP